MQHVLFYFPYCVYLTIRSSRYRWKVRHCAGEIARSAMMTSGTIGPPP